MNFHISFYSFYKKNMNSAIFVGKKRKTFLVACQIVFVYFGWFPLLSIRLFLHSMNYMFNSRRTIFSGFENIYNFISLLELFFVFFIIYYIFVIYFAITLQIYKRIKLSEKYAKSFERIFFFSKYRWINIFS